MKRLLLIAAILVVALFVWRLRSVAHRMSARDAVAAAPATATAAPIEEPPSLIPPPVPGAERSALADALNAPSGDIHADLRVVTVLLEAFRTNFPHDGNPVGSNAEITAALAGRNRLHVAVLPPNHPAINARGELCDRWGTPFFFHAESGLRMEVRSAGPDKKLWTDDDVSFTP